MLLDLYKSQAVNRLGGLAETINALMREDLASAYQELRARAPQRHDRQLHYFVAGHDGQPATTGVSNRAEEHLALALFNDASNQLLLPDGRPLTLLDYQVPLKAARADTGIGKLDLFGVVGKSRMAVIELKVPAKTGRSDTPLRAYLEALAYCAVVEGNSGAFSTELATKWQINPDPQPPAILVLAPRAYWTAFASVPAAGDWWPALQALAASVDSVLGTETHFLALDNCEFTMGRQEARPRLLGRCVLSSVRDAL